jgi:RNA polymerase sigma factor (sigma-70 family)
LTKPIESEEIADLLDQYAASLEFYASQWTDVPEDCVQEAFVALAGQANRPEHPVAWLYRVVRNRALNEFRSSRRRYEHELRSAKQNLDESSPAEQSENDEEQNRMLGVLKQLQPEDRELIVLRIWSGLSWGEIANLMKTSSSSAQRRYVAALEKMKLRLETKCLTKPE